MTARLRAKAPSARPLTVTKRDGRIETFDSEKIVSAVRRCFTNGVKLSPEAAQIQGEEARDRVLNIIGHDGREEWGVEDVQRLIIQQLWATGQFDAAEHYQNYREQRRKARSLQRQTRPEEAALIAADVAHFGSDTRYYQFLSKYARWNEEANRRETWRESCSRVLRFMRGQSQLAVVAEDIWAELDQGLYNHEATCSMRVLQMAGPALERCNVGAYNCAALDIDCLEAFAELLYTLMQGSGVGFSVEGECVDQLPRIKKQKKPARSNPFVIPDSTEGWCDALLCGLRAWFAGEDVDYDYVLIRPAGAKLKTKGGRASGPEPLRQLLAFAREKVLSRQGGRLSDLDCHDICCMIGKIVQVGGVRRAAEISISDLDSEEMRYAKHGDWWVKAPMRDMANNSAAYDEKPDPLTFLEEWIALGRSGSGERGIFNRYAINKTIPNRRKRVRFIINPCGEIILRSCQFCVSGDTPLITRSGVVRIGEAVDKKTEIWNGKRWSEVTPFQTGSDQQLVRVTFSDGSYLDCTPDHRFSVSTADSRYRGQPWREVQAKDLKPRMATETFRIQHTGGTSYQDAYTLGVLFGDGCTHHGVAIVDLYGAKMDLPITGKKNEAKLKPGYNASCVHVNCGEQHVGLMTQLRADQEEAWMSLFSWDRNSILAFIAGLADTDGSNTVANGVRIYATGRQRSAWLQLLLTKCGIRSSVNFMAAAGSETNYGRRQNDMWYVQITDCQDLPCHRLDTSRGHEPPAKGKFQTIRSVEYLPGLHDTFCFTEPEEHKGVFNNTLTYQCNLSITVARFDDTVESLRRKVRLAAIWGTLQATLTKFGYLRDKWRQNCEEERLLGVDITGQQDCPLLRYGAPGRAALLRELRQLVIDTNAEFADLLGIPRSAATTCVKPSGNSGQFFACSSGVHTRYSRHQIRRFRAGLPHLDPLTKFVEDQGVTCNIDPLNPSIMVLDFLAEPAPEGVPCRNDLTALQQLEFWLETKENWAEHSVSCTIYIEPHEWLAVGHWVYERFDRVNSIAFMPKDGGTYRLMPNQEVTAKEYAELKAAFPRIDWSKLSRYESEDYTHAASEPACTANGCEV